MSGFRARAKVRFRVRFRVGIGFRVRFRVKGKGLRFGGLTCNPDFSLAPMGYQLSKSMLP